MKSAQMKYGFSSLHGNSNYSHSFLLVEHLIGVRASKLISQPSGVSVRSHGLALGLGALGDDGVADDCDVSQSIGFKSELSVFAL